MKTVIILKLLLIFLLFGLTNQNLIAQRKNSKLINDSTKTIYGLETTKYRLEQDVLDDIDTLRALDTTLNSFHQYNLVNSNNNMYQDLASMGTAMRPIYYQTPTQIGTTLGINPYLPYTQTPDKIRYYDTKSPYTKAAFALGLRGDQMVNFLFARNIGENWNIGFEYRRLNSDKQFGRGITEADKVSADHHDFIAHLSYFSKNGRYKMLYHYSHLNQMTAETGGIYLKPGDTRDSVFGFQLETVNLQGANGWQTQSNHHLYQEFKLANGFQLFHVFDRIRQRDSYVDAGIGVKDNLNYSNYYSLLRPGRTDSVYYFRQDRTEDNQVFQQFENRVGIKGKVGGFYYQAFAKNRIFSLENTYQDQQSVNYKYDSLTNTYNPTDTVQVKINSNVIQNFVGGKLYYQFSPGNRLAVDAEYLIGKVDYKLNALFELKNVQLGFKSISVSPTLTQNNFASNILRWDNTFENTFSQEVFGGVLLRTKRLLINPYFSYHLVNNYIYYDTLALPKQSKEAVQLLKLGLNFEYRLGKWRTVNQVVYSLNLGENLIRIPNLLGNVRIYCEDCLFSKSLKSQIGVEAHFKTDYFADSYMPVSKQFYLQNSFSIGFYPIVDVFVNMKFGRNARFFFKYYHVNSSATYGYVTTPVYTGMRGTIAFGLNWMFFN